MCEPMYNALSSLSSLSSRSLPRCLSPANRPRARHSSDVCPLLCFVRPMAGMTTTSSCSGTSTSRMGDSALSKERSVKETEISREKNFVTYERREADNSAVFQIILLEQEGLFATASEDQYVRIWNYKTKRCEALYGRDPGLSVSTRRSNNEARFYHEGAVTGVAQLANGMLVSCGRDCKLVVYEKYTKRDTFSDTAPPTFSGIFALTNNAKFTRVICEAAGTRSRADFTVTLTEGDIVEACLQGSHTWTRSYIHRVNPDGTFALRVSSSNKIVAAVKRDSIRLPGGNYILATCDDGSLHRYEWSDDTSSLELLSRSEISKRSLQSVLKIRGENLILASGLKMHYVVTLHSKGSGALEQLLPTIPHGALASKTGSEIAMHDCTAMVELADGTIVTGSSEGKSMSFWKYDQRELEWKKDSPRLDPFPHGGSRFSITTVSDLTDGRVAFGGGGGELVILQRTNSRWKVEQRLNLKLCCKTHFKYVYSIVQLPDGKVLFGMQDGHLREFTLDDPRILSDDDDSLASDDDQEGDMYDERRSVGSSISPFPVTIEKGKDVIDLCDDIDYIAPSPAPSPAPVATTITKTAEAPQTRVTKVLPAHYSEKEIIKQHSHNSNGELLKKSYEDRNVDHVRSSSRGGESCKGLAPNVPSETTKGNATVTAIMNSQKSDEEKLQGVLAIVHEYSKTCDKRIKQIQNEKDAAVERVQRNCKKMKCEAERRVQEAEGREQSLIAETEMAKSSFNKAIAEMAGKVESHRKLSVAINCIGSYWEKGTCEHTFENRTDLLHHERECHSAKIMSAKLAYDYALASVEDGGGGSNSARVGEKRRRNS